VGGVGATVSVAHFHITTEKHAKKYPHNLPIKKVRVKYTIDKKRRITGMYTEYDKDGNKVLEFPMKDGKGTGYGRVVENGKVKTNIAFFTNSFGDLIALDMNKADPESKEYVIKNLGHAPRGSTRLEKKNRRIVA
jgi:hypothetical protein